jgi:hypothetical protein
MNILIKIILSIILLFLGIIGGGIWPYIPGVGILISIGLFTASIIGIIAIWKKRPVEGEGNTFKNQDRLNKN